MKNLQNKVVVLVALATGFLAWGSQVLIVSKDGKMVAISHDVDRPWKVQDKACVVQSGESLACGLVLKSSPKGAILKLDFAKKPIIRGDVVRAAQNNGRLPSAKVNLLNSVVKEKEPTGAAYRFDISAGGTAGTTFLYPILFFQVAIDRHFTLGAQPMFLSASANDATATALGFFGSLNYYATDTYQGVWGQLGLGALMYSASNTASSEKITQIGVLTTIGWRSYWDLGLNIGIAAGALYTPKPEFTVIDLEFGGFRPVVAIDIGFCF